MVGGATMAGPKGEADIAASPIGDCQEAEPCQTQRAPRTW